MTRSSVAIAIATSLALLASPASAKRKPVESWGRAGVDFETYRNDSLECALIGYYADVSETEQAQKFVKATQRLENSDDHSMGTAVGTPAADNAVAGGDMYRIAQIAARTEQIRSSIRPQKLMNELQQGLVGVVEQCLIERGYVQFRLTESQSKQLSRLKSGSPERHQFLHALASDPKVLDVQAIPSAAG
jgi:hypothetical protein